MGSNNVVVMFTGKPTIYDGQIVLFLRGHILKSSYLADQELEFLPGKLSIDNYSLHMLPDCADVSFLRVIS